MIGVVIPAHNEEVTLPACLSSVLAAAARIATTGETVEVVVALDHCTDGSADVVSQFPVTALPIRARNVGIARHCAALYLLERGARWLAFTDADTTVDAAWLYEQVALRASVVCGTVCIDRWDTALRAVQDCYSALYSDEDGHRHIHGANFGIDAKVYAEMGGFPPLPTDEDRTFVEALERAGVAIAWSARPRVWTSGRLINRVQGGFGGYLRKLCAALPGGPVGDEATPLDLASEAVGEIPISLRAG
ncbi:glycosyltransferase family 2 protein [Ralstonia pickettii]|uniref:glycosyltransferase n=1 Tax=Ralstonia pickettii TaxID=329 RepID=UPI00271471C5|nr:glycosyltransferase family A protein [Ralstonia pickettii]WKZ86472.1 glycosyltransferase family 2 protein [Ralstonia pickettii]